MKEDAFEDRLPKFARDLEVHTVEEFSTVWNWGRSISHVLFTLGVPFGIIFTLGSYNRYNASTIRDASLISLFAVLLPMIFGVLLGCFFGFFAHQANVKVTSLVPWPGGFNGYVEHSTFFLFVRMPQVLSKLQPAPQAWLIIFYTLAVVLGIHSLCIYAETVRACIQDLCPKCLKTKNLGHSIGVTIGVVLLLCAGSLSLATSRSNFITQTLSIVIALPLPFMMLLGALLLIFGYAISHYRSHFKSIVNSDSMRSGKCPWVFCVMFIVVGCLTVPIGLVLQTAFTYCFEADKWVLQPASTPTSMLTTDPNLAPPVSQDNWESLGFAIAVEAIVLLLIFLTMIFKCVAKCRTPYGKKQQANTPEMRKSQHKSDTATTTVTFSTTTETTTATATTTNIGDRDEEQRLALLSLRKKNRETLPVTQQIVGIFSCFLSPFPSFLILNLRHPIHQLYTHTPFPNSKQIPDVPSTFEGQRFG